MAVDDIRYDLLAKEALRGVVRTVLAGAAKNGLPGEHHFYISFDTRADGVRLSPRMHAQYPTEMTIVLQHQFWDLIVSEGGFEVGLSFGGILERLAVPFAAVKGFFDPSVQFGLQFEEIGEAALQAKSENESEAQAEHSGAERRGKDRGAERLPAEAKDTRPAITVVPVPANPAADETRQDPGKPAGGGEIVPLDRFRRK